MSNPNQTNNDSQPVIQPRRRFGLGRQLYGFITKSLKKKAPVDGVVPPITDEISPILPGSYRFERLNSGANERGTFQEPGLASLVSEEVTSHVREEFVQRDLSGAPTATHSPYYDNQPPSAIRPESKITAIPTQFQGASGFNISGNPNFTNIGVNSGVNNVINYHGGSHGLENMEKYVSFDAFYNSAVQDPDRKCHPGTRIIVLNRIRTWFNNMASAEHAFWLHGPAGAGKSAIAQTIARSCSRGQIAATFFFYRSDPSRNNGNALFTTIAWQLAFSIPGIKDHIVRAFNERPDLPRMDVETQFEEFIARPFRAMKDASTHLPSSVVIIDGVDECIDEKLQKRFLKVIGNAIKDSHVPLRFLICSRPEAHIQEAIGRFPKPNIQTDLASLDDANHDIEKYLKDEFSRIASEQDLDPTTWPGQDRIQKVIYKSSGQFVYASLVIRFVGDEFNTAVTQLDIILGLKPHSSKSPFAELDALFTEILERQPDQAFLMTFLALLVARLSIPRVSYGTDDDRFHLDDAMLMNVSVFELHRKLRGMRSLFKFEPHIDLHHRSFLDFLQDPTRSCQFYIGNENAQRRYLESIIDSVVQFASKIIDQPNYHETSHFCPQFRRISLFHPRRIILPLTEWQTILKPLLRLQNKLLTLPNFTSTWSLLPCDTCTVFQIMRDFLLHLIVLHRTCHSVDPSIQTTESGLNDPDITRTDRFIEAEGSDHADDVVGCVQSLLSELRKLKLGSFVNAKTFDLMRSLLCFDHAEVVKRVYSVGDAQILMDFIDSLTNNGYFLSQCGSDTASKIVRLALRIFSRVPVLPRSLFSNNDTCSGHDWRGTVRKTFEIRCQTALLRRISDQNYVVPLLRIYERDGDMWFVSSTANKSKNLTEWRKKSKPSSVERIRAMLELAKAIRYLHSIGVTLCYDIEPHDIFLDSELHVKICVLLSTSRYLAETPSRYLLYGTEKEWDSSETNVFIFGCFFHETYFDHTLSVSDRRDCKNSKVSKRPSEPKIREDAWQLIQRCCASDAKARPSIDHVVREMESWNLS